MELIITERAARELGAQTWGPREQGLRTNFPLIIHTHTDQDMHTFILTHRDMLLN